MDLRWFPPRDAQRLLQLGLESKLLESHEGTIRPAFDVATVEVPRDYVPTAAILETPTPTGEGVFLMIVEAMARKTAADRKAIVAIVNGVQERLDVDVEVAALVAARQAGVDITSFVAPVKARLGLA